MRWAGLAFRHAPRAFAAFAFACLALAPPLSAATNDDGSEIRTALGAIQEKDQKLQNIGWRLITGNAVFCEQRQSAIGLQLLDLASFRSPNSIRQAFSMQGDFLVQTVAKGSPAELAGVAPNSEVKAIDERPLSDAPTAGAGDWQRLKETHDEIDKALTESGKIALSPRNGIAIELSGVPACSTRFELKDNGKRAIADGSRVQIGAKFVGFDYPEDELAAAIAHELAHNILGHRAWLEKVGRKRNNIRITEREADRLMPWLLANSGYDPWAALRFMRRWGPRHSGGLFRKRTHEGWDERAEHITAELEAMQQFWDGSGRADWGQYFARETSAD